LAAVREYLPSVRPAVVLRMYFEGNDFADLAKEAENPRSSTHLRAARGIST
jgi:epoxyqueuosine reductase QueG